MEEGKIKVTDSAIISAIGSTVSKIDGVHGLSGGLVDGLFKKESSRGIILKLSDENRSIDINIIAKHGYNIAELGKKIQEKVGEDLRNTMNLDVSIINVYVDKIVEEEKADV